MVLASMGRKVESPSSKVKFRHTRATHSKVPLQYYQMLHPGVLSNVFICTVMITIILKSHIEIRVLNGTA